MLLFWATREKTSPPARDLDVEPFPDENRIRSNRLSENGKAPDERLSKKHGLSGRDHVSDGTGQGNARDQPGASAYPDESPRAR